MPLCCQDINLGMILPNCELLQFATVNTARRCLIQVGETAAQYHSTMLSVKHVWTLVKTQVISCGNPAHLEDLVH